MSEMDRSTVNFKHKIKMLTLCFASVFFVIASVLMLAFLYPKKNGVVHADTSTYWSNYAATAFAGGTGTSSDPYLISNASELAYLAKYTNGGFFTTDNYRYFKLTKPIDLSAHNWVPIGSGIGKAFYGELDCDNYPIVGLKITQNVEYAGLFGFVDSLVIKNAIISDANINITKDYGSAGIIAGSINYSNGELKVIDSMITGSITHTSYPSATDGVGGLVGSIRSCSFSDCLFENVSINVKITTPNRKESACTGVLAGFSNIDLTLGSNVQNIVANADVYSSTSTLTRKIYYGDFGGTSASDWFYNDILSNGIPLQKSKFWLGKDSSATGTQIVSQLDSKGYSKTDTILGFIPPSQKYVITTNYIVTNNSSRTGFTCAAQTRTGFPNAVYGEKVSLSNKTITGYNFETYRVDGNDISGDYFLMPERDVTVTAVFTPERYTITLDPNGGTVTPTTKTIEFDGTYSDLPTPTREGFTFNGWIGKNLFNKDAQPFNTYAISSEGKYVYVSSYATYQISVPAGKKITITCVGANDSYLHLNMGYAFFDDDGQYISGDSYVKNQKVYTVLVPAKAVYLRATVCKDSSATYRDLDYFQVEIGSQSTEYEEYIKISSETKVESTATKILCASWRENKAFFRGGYNSWFYTVAKAVGIESRTFNKNIKTIEFTSTLPLEGTAVSIGMIDSSSNTSSHLGTWEYCFDIIAYVTGDTTNGFNVKFYSPYVIYFPENCEFILHENVGASYGRFEKLESFVCNGLVDTSRVVSMKNLFYWCEKLKYLDISNFDTSNVTSMSSMFSSCSKLTTLNVSNFDTSNVTSMSSMFSSCSKLTTLNVSNFDTSNVTSMSSMFSSCSKLTTLNVSNFNTSNVTNMSGMFNNCSALTSLDISNFDTSNVTNMYGMFNNCSALTSLDISNFDTSNVTNMYGMFSGCKSLTSINLTSFDTPKATNMYQMFYNCTSLTTIDLSNFDTSKVTTMSSMFYNCSTLTSLDVSNFDTSKVTTMSSMFYNCSTLTSLDVSIFDTSKVTTMSSMFYNCSTLTSLDASNFDTSNVTTMYQMFYKCSSLTNINLNNFDTSNVTTMESMFYNCTALTTIDVSMLNTSNVTNMSGMFSGCSSLTSLDVSNFNTSNVTNMSGMFPGCSTLTTLDISMLNTSNVTSMSSMFSGCSGLTSLDINMLNTSNVTNMSGMFNNCSALTSLDISNFDTSNVTNMSNMFRGLKLTVLDLKGLNVTKVKNLAGTFADCTNLLILDLSTWEASSVNWTSGIFDGTTMQWFKTPLMCSYTLYWGWNSKALYDQELKAHGSASQTESEDLRTKYKITFDANGGVCEEASREIRYAENYGIRASLPTASKEGYTFNGWALSDGTIVSDDTSMLQISNHTLYAQWAENLITVTFVDNNGGRLVTNSLRFDAAAGVYPLYLPFPINYENGNFYGWSIDPTATESSPDSLFANEWEVLLSQTDHVLYAIYGESDGGYSPITGTGNMAQLCQFYYYPSNKEGFELKYLDQRLLNCFIKFDGTDPSLEYRYNSSICFAVPSSADNAESYLNEMMLNPGDLSGSVSIVFDKDILMFDGQFFTVYDLEFNEIGRGIIESCVPDTAEFIYSDFESSALGYLERGDITSSSFREGYFNVTIGSFEVGDAVKFAYTNYDGEAVVLDAEIAYVSPQSDGTVEIEFTERLSCPSFSNQRGACLIVKCEEYR